MLFRKNFKSNLNLYICILIESLLVCIFLQFKFYDFDFDIYLIYVVFFPTEPDITEKFPETEFKYRMWFTSTEFFKPDYKDKSSSRYINLERRVVDSYKAFMAKKFSNVQHFGTKLVAVR